MHLEHELLLGDFFLERCHLWQLRSHRVETWTARILNAVQIVIVSTFCPLLFLRIRLGKGIHVVNKIVHVVQLVAHHFVLRGNSHLFVHIVSRSLILHTMILLLICLKVPRYRFLLFVKLSEELLILENCSLFSFLFLLLGCLFSNNLSSRNASKII